MNTLPADVLAKIDQVAQLVAAQSVCHYNTQVPAGKLIREVFEGLGPLVPLAQKLLFERSISVAATISLDVDKAVAFCKSVAYLAN